MYMFGLGMRDVSVRTIFQRMRFGLDISFHQIHPRHDRRLGGIRRVVLIDLIAVHVSSGLTG